MKKDEFSWQEGFVSSQHDTFFCPLGAYAIAHLYLQKYDDQKILSFCDQGIQLLKTSEQILANNVEAILAYQPKGKDLKLVWEVSDKSLGIIKAFGQYQKFGKKEALSGTIDDNSFSLVILTIESENLKQFQEGVADNFAAQAALFD